MVIIHEDLDTNDTKASVGQLPKALSLLSNTIAFNEGRSKDKSTIFRCDAPNVVLIVSDVMLGDV
jgi:hypothetical protein